MLSLLSNTNPSQLTCALRLVNGLRVYLRGHPSLSRELLRVLLLLILQRLSFYLTTLVLITLSAYVTIVPLLLRMSQKIVRRLVEIGSLL